MKIKAIILLKKMYQFYFCDIDAYHPYNDPELTFQEYVLIRYLDAFTKYDIVDTDKINYKRYLYPWMHSTAGFFYQPVLIDKPWNKVFVDRCHKDNNLETKRYGDNNYYGDKSPYRELLKLQSEFFDHLVEEEEKRKILQRDKQREYRARKKLEKQKASK